MREGEAGRKVADLVRTHGITEQTYYRWIAKYGGMELSEMQRLKQLEDENRRLKQIVAEQTLDIQALYARGVTLRFIRPGKPIENAYVESVNGKFRDECLNEHWFVSLAEARRSSKRGGSTTTPSGHTARSTK